MNQEGGKQSDYEVHPEKPVVKVTVGKNSVELPVIVIPGMNAFTVALAVGYGRESANKDETKNNIGKSANGAGKNVYPFVGFNGTNIYSSIATVEKTGTKYPLAQTQVHGFTESRPVIYETNLKAYNSKPSSAFRR